jgi:hypothetical protein
VIPTSTQRDDYLASGQNLDVLINTAIYILILLNRYKYEQITFTRSWFIPLTAIHIC